MGIFLQSTEATSCGHHLKRKLTPKNPCGHHVHFRHIHGSPMKNRWRFSKFNKKYETLTLTLKICILQENGFKELTMSCLQAWFKGYTSCFTTFLVRPSTGAQQSHERAQIYVQKTSKDQSFVNKFKVLFVCLPEDV
jgi:hypothetical protein